MEGWMDERMNRWMDGDGWMDGWMSEFSIDDG